MRKHVLWLMACLFFAVQLWAQTRTVTGKVTDEKGDPVAGASVTVKGAKGGTMTAEDGTYKLDVPAGAKTLVISSVNFKAQELTIGDRTQLDAVMSASASSLDEVVVVAYGTQKKPEITGAINKVAAKQIENRPFTSVDKTLQGQVPGVQISSGSGQPGSATDIRIRGFTSITAGNAPLWVVDGVPILTGDASRQVTTANLLSTLNPNDIESVSVLKDASATSLYGSRGANGVILVTTKSGKAGKTKFSFDTEIGYSDIAYQNDLYRPMNALEYIELTREGLVNAGASQATITSTLNALGANNGTDYSWLDATTRRGRQQNYNIGMNGGNEKTTFNLSGGYFWQEGLSLASEFKRYSAAIGLRHKVNNRLSFSLNSNVGVVDQETPLAGGAFGNPVLASYFVLPTRPPFKPDGSYNILTPDFPNGQLYNPLYIANTDKRLLKQNSIRSTISGEYKILKNLKFTSRYGLDYNVLEEDQYNNPFYGDGQTVNGRGLFAYTRYTNWVWTNMLDYHQALNKDDDIYVDVKVGYESQKSLGVFGNVRADNFPPNTALQVPSAGALPFTAAKTGGDFSFVAAPFTTAAFNFKDRYVVTGSFRRDGSSRFGENNRWGTFWSVGGTWNIDKEQFMANQNLISQLKFRGSYGTTGNAAIGNYDWRLLYGYGSNYNQNPGSSPATPGNNDLTWETNTQLNFGLDFGLWKNRISGSFDWYNRKTTDILLNEPVSLTTGFSSTLKNVGEMENKGFEILLNVVPVQTRNFKWDMSFNYSRNQNKILKLAAGQTETINGIYIWRPGLDYQTIYARQWAGVNPANGDPLWYTDDTRKTTTNNWNQALRTTTFGSATPKFFGGFTNNLSFMGITLSAQFVFQGGNYVRDGWGGFYTSSGQNPTFNKVYRQFAERWRQPGDNAGMPRYVYNNGRLAQNFSTFFLSQGDYVRLRDLTLGYNLPKDLLGRIGLNSLYIYGRAVNAWTWVKDDKLPWDPEQGVDSQSNLDIFIPKTFTIGLNLGF